MTIQRDGMDTPTMIQLKLKAKNKKQDEFVLIEKYT